jgi:hypothetical protein
MSANMRRNLAGPFVARDMGRDSWRLTRSAAPALELFVHGAAHGFAEALSARPVTQIDIDWQRDACMLTLSYASGQRCIKATSAILHEPKPALYEVLPLASFDAPARRFWRKVFRLASIPGGRFLLGLLARRNRGGA